MYKLVRIIGIIIRSNFLANAFEYYFDSAGIGLIYAYIINATLGEELLRMTSYGLVSSFYEKNSFPTIGSISYTLAYVINNSLLIASCLMCRYFNLHIAIAIVVYTIIEMIFFYMLSRVKSTNITFYSKGDYI